jgi:hypothetical protein
VAVYLIRADWGACVRAGPLTTRLRALRSAEHARTAIAIPTSEWPLVCDALILASGKALRSEHLTAGALLDEAWCEHLAASLHHGGGPVAAALAQRHRGGVLHPAAKPQGVNDGWLQPLAAHLAASTPHGVLVAGDATTHPPTTETP